MPVLPTEKLREKKRLVREFRAFVDRGNVVELGVAFVMGATFKTVIDALAGDGGKNPGILGGLIGAIFGGKTPNFNDKGVTLNGSFLPFGSLLTAAFNFLLVSLAMFLVIRLYNRFRSGEANAKPAPTTNEILTEIRDELRRRP
ncbi:MAG: MscL family protein [Actinobacteria bacterium]|nr:MscL family protein [Actinomycetota bacterium]